MTGGSRPGRECLGAPLGQVRRLVDRLQTGGREATDLRAEVGRLRQEYEALRAELERLRWAAGWQEPGHYYSPVPTLEAARAAATRPVPLSLPGIDMHLDEQLKLATVLGALSADQPFGEQHRSGLRYQFANDFFGFDDGLVLHLLLRHLRPRRVIEVGSGWSSACMLDTDELFLEGATEFTFIDPEPDRLEELLTGSETSPRLTIHRTRVQDVSPQIFDELDAGDVLFIDSSHVVKAGSEVLQLCLDVVPALPAGVWVHLHDIPWPFEYPLVWAEERRWWTEAYLVRALLTHNRRLEVRWCNSYLQAAARDEVAALLPPFRGDGLSIWLEVVGPA